jgi:hypothetical protein
MRVLWLLFRHFLHWRCPIILLSRPAPEKLAQATGTAIGSLQCSLLCAQYFLAERRSANPD